MGGRTIGGRRTGGGGMGGSGMGGGDVGGGSMGRRPSFGGGGVFGDGVRDRTRGDNMDGGSRGIEYGARRGEGRPGRRNEQYTPAQLQPNTPRRAPTGRDWSAQRPPEPEEVPDAAGAAEPTRPAGVECYMCGQLGHRARDCPDRESNPASADAPGLTAPAQRQRPG
eukprot:SAG11_NODE_7961_length_1077_cov_1.486708_1_plen_166_part_10